MICPNCKNPIQENSFVCEWCGHELIRPKTTSTLKSPPENRYAENIDELRQRKVEELNKAKPLKIYFLLPGIFVLFIWIIGNVISERDKYAIFGMDDLSPILLVSIVLIIIGFFISLATRKNAT
jgi:hypothetical protein